MNMYTLTINMLYGVGERERKRERQRVTWQMRKERRLVNPEQWLVEYIHFLCTCVIVTQHKAQILCSYTSKKTWPHITIDKPWNTKCFNSMDWEWECFLWSDYHQSPESKIEVTRLKNCIYIQQFKSGKIPSLIVVGDKHLFYKTTKEDNWLVFWLQSKLKCEVHIRAFHINSYLHLVSLITQEKFWCIIPINNLYFSSFWSTVLSK